MVRSIANPYTCLQALAIGACHKLLNLASWKIHFAPAPSDAPLLLSRGIICTQVAAQLDGMLSLERKRRLPTRPLCWDVERHLNHARTVCPSLQQLVVEESVCSGEPQEPLTLRFEREVDRVA